MLHDEIWQVIDKRASLHIEDDFQIENCREKLIEILSVDVTDTINFLEKTDKDKVLWISEVFEEIAYNLQNKQYIECLKKLDIKYPELKLTNTIRIAEEYMD